MTFLNSPTLFPQAFGPSRASTEFQLPRKGLRYIRNMQALSRATMKIRSQATDRSILRWNINLGNKEAATALYLYEKRRTIEDIASISSVGKKIGSFAIVKLRRRTAVFTLNFICRDTALPKRGFAAETSILETETSFNSCMSLSVSNVSQSCVWRENWNVMTCHFDCSVKSDSILLNKCFYNFYVIEGKLIDDSTKIGPK